MLNRSDSLIYKSKLFKMKHITLKKKLILHNINQFILIVKMYLINL